MRRLTATVVGVSLLSGCATLTGPRRTFTFAASGAAAGAIGGTALSPNNESRGLNALVFGLSGALLGGVAAVLSDRKDEVAEEPKSIDQNTLLSPTKTSTVAPYESLPEYVKQRLQPIVIEEFTEADQVDEDGVLREPHKAYRIKRQPEFNPRPLSSQTGGSK